MIYSVKKTWVESANGFHAKIKHGALCVVIFKFF